MKLFTGDENDGAKIIGKIYSKIDGEEKKADKMFNDLEKNFGLRVKQLNEYEDSEDEAANNPLKDVEIFKEVVKDTYGSLKRKHRGIVDDLRTTEYDTFSKIGAMNEKVSETAGSKIDQEVRKLK